MNNPGSMVINISANNEITLEFTAPTKQVSESEGLFSLPAEPLLRAEDDPIAYGRILSQALYASQPVRDLFRDALNVTVHASPPRPLHIRLDLPAETVALHNLAWETLLNPINDQPLIGGGVYFFRFLQSNLTISHISDISPLPRALIFIANPSRLAGKKITAPDPRPGPENVSVDLTPIEVDDELAHARQGMQRLRRDVITSDRGKKGVASLARLLSALEDPDKGPYHILYLVCHGAIYNNQPHLWLDEENELPVAAQYLINGLIQLKPERRPRLIMLVSCQSAGRSGAGNPASVDRGVLAALGPKLVREAGIAAVVAMQGNVFMRSVERMIPTFFKELVQTGQVGRAMSAARGRLFSETDALIRNQWYVPALFSCLADGQLWPPAQSAPPTVYLSHAIRAADSEVQVLDATREMLGDLGFEVLESNPHPEAAPPWSQRLLDGLGTCDAAVLLLNQRAFEADWVQIEAIILGWRKCWLDTDFQLLSFCLDAASLPETQWPWNLLRPHLTPTTLTSATQADLSAKLQAFVKSIVLEKTIQQDGVDVRWMLLKLELAVIKQFEKMGLDDILRGTVRKLEMKYGLPVLDDETARRCARLVLIKGLVALGDLWDDLCLFLTAPVKQNFNELLSPAKPAWVNIAGAAQIVFLATQHTAESPATFYLKRTGTSSSRLLVPLPWIGMCYVARICGMSYGAYAVSNKSRILVVAPEFSGNKIQRLNQIEEELARELPRIEKELWTEAWSNVPRSDLQDEGWGDMDEMGTFVEVDYTQHKRNAIKYCVEKRTAQNRPVLLVLSGEAAAYTPLLDTIQQSFGPLMFFFVCKEQAPPAYGSGPRLEVELPIQIVDEAYDLQNDLLAILAYISHINK